MKNNPSAEVLDEDKGTQIALDSIPVLAEGTLSRRRFLQMSTSVAGILTLDASAAPKVKAAIANRNEDPTASAKPPLDTAIEKKVNALLAKMTLEEKVFQLCAVLFGTGTEIANEDGVIAEKDVAAQLGEHGVGSIGFIGSPTIYFGVREGIEAVNSLQRHSIENTRLGIPVLINSEGLHGLVMKDACSYPQAIALAATFNPALVEEIAIAIGKEARSRGIRQLFSPVLNLGREPRHGRVEESYGEDPFLASRMGVAYVRGVQSCGVICTAKHFVANFAGAGGREGVYIDLSERALRESYFIPYEAVVREAGVLGFMSAYNAVNGTPCSADHWLLTDVLREEWGFQGIVVSDWSAVNHVLDKHHLVATKGEAARLCLNAGLDVDLPRINYYKELMSEVNAGRLPEETLNESVRRVLRLKYLLDLFENPYTDPVRAEQLADAPEHRQLALTAARQSIVLLKNDQNVLPFKPFLKKIAVIGPNADTLQLGGYSPKGVHGVTPLAGLKNLLGSRVEIAYARGCGLDDAKTDGISEAVAIAQDADLCVLVVGGSNGLTGGESRERASLELLGQQELLMERIAATGKPTVVVVVDGRPVVMDRWIDKVAAIVMAWFPGEEGGTAIAEILTGAVNPSGRLPITFPRMTGQLPMPYDFYPYGREGHYVEIPGKERYIPRFPFGFGLSYTTFGYTNLKCFPQNVSPGAKVTVSVDVTNTGSVPGEEVVQLYLSDEICRITQPVQRLRRFSRVSLASGERRTVSFTLEFQNMAFLNEHLKPEVEPGVFRVRVGGNCLSEVTGSFVLTA